MLQEAACIRCCGGRCVPEQVSCPPYPTHTHTHTHHTHTHTTVFNSRVTGMQILGDLVAKVGSDIEPQLK